MQNVCRQMFVFFLSPLYYLSLELRLLVISLTFLDLSYTQFPGKKTKYIVSAVQRRNSLGRELKKIYLNIKSRFRENIYIYCF